MKALLEEIENNLATLRCRLEAQGISAMTIGVDSWEKNTLGFEIGVYDGKDWMRFVPGGVCKHSIKRFCELLERRKILFRKFGGV